MKRPEEALQRTVVDWMRAVFPPPPEGPVWFHVPNGGGRSKAEGGVLKAMGTRPGMPDLALLWQGRHAWIELKAAGGRTTTEQRLCHQALMLAGGVVRVCRSLEDVRDFVEVLGIPTRERRPA